MEADAREQLIARFVAYLDAASEPSSEAARSAPDLFTLLSEVAALKNEVKLEARQVKTALDQFRELFDTLRQANERLDSELERCTEQARLAHQQRERELLLELLDLRDRLQAGHDQAQRYRPGWLARRGGAAEFVGGMAEGGAMSLRRLDELLARRDVLPLEVVGAAFDPQTMQVGDVVEDRSRPDGQVLAERRRGFRQRDRLLRPAEVIVNKRPPD
jgi:molecular chaperone GrpE